MLIFYSFKASGSTFSRLHQRLLNMFSKGYPLEAKTAPKNWNQSVHTSRARLASLCLSGPTSDPPIVSKFHSETHDPKGQENKIYTIVKGRQTFYRRHTVTPAVVKSNKYVLKRYPAKELKPECAHLQGQTN